ncbi:ABC transporter substrate-binding protein [[Limnothrix rosea] IAM M-220]|uniref:ABC transporter substrate-binding protein n=1 Tax=[Limnothrix rosea] IAM M-220 TaxID=454133 RepID=UPI000969E479|nr:ABC transporter substrate-binding protein [[Limnothrix rosea] IAM M-220]OKH17744.1 amino acid ABC transporter substrate-binding protein [[Limnothrix rosea] IAM M-220]
MGKSRFNTAIALFLAALTAFTAACQETAPPGGAEGGETTETSAGGDEGGLKLGSLTPTTGDLSSIGQNMPVAVQLAVDTINACGGVNDMPVGLVQEDSQTDPTAGGAAMTKLAEVDKVAGVVGSFASSVSSAAVDVAVRNGVMQISPGSTSPVFTERAAAGDFDGYWARTAPPDSYQAPALAVLAQKQGFERVATVVINNDYGVGFEQEFVKAFEKLGGTIVNKDNPVRYDPKAATLDSEAAAAFAGEPDAVLGVLYAETGSVLLKAAYEQGLSEGVTVLLTDGVYSPDFTQQVGTTPDGKSIIAGSLGTVPGADGVALAEFTTLWQEETGKEVSAFVPHSWDAAIAMMLAAEKADVNTGEGIRDNLRAVTNEPGEEVSDPCEAIAMIREGKEINYQGASGNVEFDDNGDLAGSYDVWQVNEDGSLEVIDTVSPVDAL